MLQFIWLYFYTITDREVSIKVFHEKTLASCDLVQSIYGLKSQCLYMFVKCYCFCIVPVIKIILNQNVICLSIKFQTYGHTSKGCPPFLGNSVQCSSLHYWKFIIRFTRKLPIVPPIMSNPTLQTKLHTARLSLAMIPYTCSCTCYYHIDKNSSV